MKLSKIYANKNFQNISFNEGFNVILGEIHDRTHLEKDTHNLGKTALIYVIDFILLKGINQSSFLKNSFFNEHIFYGELLLNSGKYLLIRRSIENASKVSYKLSDKKLESFEYNIEWEVENLSFDKAKKQLNKYLNFDVLTKWLFRKSINFFLRTQNDFLDVFKLDKFKGKDKDWKPVIYELLGFISKTILDKYDIEEKINILEQEKKTIEKKLSLDIEERDKLTGLIELKQDEFQKTEKLIDKFNFFEQDKILNQTLVEKLDEKIQILNTQRYNIDYEIEKINKSLNSNGIEINLDEIKQLYEEVNIFFKNDLLKNYDDLINFNKSITEERKKYLIQNLEQLKNELNEIETELFEFEKEKESLLSFLTEKDSYKKFKDYQRQLAKSESEILLLKEQLKNIDIVAGIMLKIEKKKEELDKKIKEISEQVKTSKHSNIRKLFNNVIKDILNVSALISIKQNTQGNIEFQADCQNPENLTITSQSYGTTYKKLLCIAFDIAVLINYSQNSFFKFVYHDGALEGLDDRKKIKFLNLVKKICSENNLQYIITLIDSDLPKNEKNEIIKFDDNEICLKLSDKDDNGLLFKAKF